MPTYGFKDNKCRESAIWYRGTWSFDVSAGDTETESFPLQGNYPDNPVVIVTPNTESYDPSEIQVFGYVNEDNSEVIIGVTNNSSSALETFNVNFVVI